MSINNRVWELPNQMEVNLNQTALHSENPLMVKLKPNQSTVVPVLASDTDFLLTQNLSKIFNNSKIIDVALTNPSIFQGEIASKIGLHDIDNPKILHPREDTSIASSSNFQIAEQTTMQYDKTSDVVPLKNVQAIPETQHGKELEPTEKIYTAIRLPQNQVYQSLLNAPGIECREETVETPEDEEDTVCVPTEEGNDQYTQGEITYGSHKALEKLAKDVNKLKTGTHGVITYQNYNFLTNPKLAHKRQKILGRGGNGTVELWSCDETQFVTKTIFRDFRANEVLFTNTLSHEFIVRSHGLIVRNGTPQIIMDYAGDNLLHYGLSRMVEEKEIWNFTFQILEALNYLHSKQIRHFDVKPENIILMEDEFGIKTPRLADFGGASLFTDPVDCLSWTPAYMAPEMCQFYLNRQFPKQQAFHGSCGPVTEKCDIYSLALSILFLYVRGHVLIKHATKGMQNIVGTEKADTVSMKIVISNAKNPDLAVSLIPPSVGREMREILISMLCGKVDDRVTAKHIMNRMRELSCDAKCSAISKKVVKRKCKLVENKPRLNQPLRPKTPKLVIVTVDQQGREISKFTNTEYTVSKNYERNLDTSEQQRPLRDLNVDLQLHMILDQTKEIKDANIKHVIEEENRPLLRRLVKRKLKDKVSEDIAFKMTKMQEELESSASSSRSSASGKFSSSVNVIPDEPSAMEEEPLGNLPNFDILNF